MNKSQSDRLQVPFLNSRLSLQKSRKSIVDAYERNEQSVQYRRMDPKKSLENYLSNGRWTIDVPRHPLKNASPLTFDYKNESIRSIRREKRLLSEQISSSLRQSRYLQARQRHQERIISMLEERNNKMIQIRRQKAEERIENKKKMIMFQEQVENEKKGMKRKVHEMKANLVYLKHAFKQQKKHNAHNIRSVHQEHQVQSLVQKEVDLEQKQIKCNVVKKGEKLGAIKLKKITQDKFREVLNDKRKRILTQISQKHQIQLVSERVREEVAENLINYRQKLSLYEQRIALLREQLGDSRAKYGKARERSIDSKRMSRGDEDDFNKDSSTL